MYFGVYRYNRYVNNVGMGISVSGSLAGKGEVKNPTVWQAARALR